MEQLCIRLLPDTRTAYAEWALYAGGLRTCGSALPVPLAHLPDAVPPPGGAPREVTVIVPGPHALLCRAEVPPKQVRHLRSILPFLVEDRLAEDIAQLHVAATPVDPVTGQVTVAVVRRTLMEAWLAQLADAGFHPRVMLCETSLIPCLPDTWRLLCDGETAWIAAGAQGVFAVEKALLPDFFGVLMRSHAGQPQPVDCRLFGAALADGTAETLMHIQKACPQSPMRVRPGGSVMDMFCQGILKPAETPALNLMQGAYAPGSLRRDAPAARRHVLYVAGVWFLAMLALTGLQAGYFSYRAALAQGQAAALYHSLFPDDTKLIDPMAQMQAKLEATRADASGMLPLLAKLSDAWPARPEDSVQMQGLRYEDSTRTLTLSVRAPGIAAINALAERLDGTALQARVLSVAGEAEAASGQLAVTATP